MRLMLDEDSQSKLVVRLLREAGHDVLTVGEAELEAHRDEDVLARARMQDRVLLTRNVSDFLVLHTLNPAHAGIVAEYQDRDPTKNLSSVQIVKALGNLQTSGWNLHGQFVALNAWNY